MLFIVGAASASRRLSSDCEPQAVGRVTLPCKHVVLRRVQYYDEEARDHRPDLKPCTQMDAPPLEQRDLSASLLSARSFSAFSDEGDHVHDDGGRGERRQRLLLRILGLSFEEPRAFWRWYRAVYGFLVLAATVGYGVCYAGVLALADGGAADVCARKAVYAALALAAYAVALVDARRGNLPPPSQDPAHDSRVQRVPPPPPPPLRLLGCGFALFVAAHASATCRNLPASPLRPALFAAADLFAFLPRLGPIACLVLRCGALDRG